MAIVYADVDAYELESKVGEFERKLGEGLLKQ